MNIAASLRPAKPGKKEPSIKREMTVEVDGVAHTGSALLDDGRVTVSTDYGSRSTLLGERDFVLLARLMLGEIVREEKRKRLTTEPRQPR